MIDPSVQPSPSLAAEASRIARIREGETNGAAIAQPQAPIPAMSSAPPGLSRRGCTNTRHVATSATITGPKALASAARPVHSAAPA